MMLITSMVSEWTETICPFLHTVKEAGYLYFTYVAWFENDHLLRTSSENLNETHGRLEKSVCR